MYQYERLCCLSKDAYMLCIIAQTKIDERISSLFFYVKELIAFVCLCLQAARPRPYLALFTLVCNYVLRKNSPEFKHIYRIWRGAPLSQ